MTHEPEGRGHVLHVLLAVAAFLVVSSLIRSAVPWPEEYGMQAKMDAFFDTKDEYTAVYLGPSTVYRSFRPNLIDPRVSAETEAPFHSYNLGMGALFGHEIDSQLRAVLAARPERLEWVFIQPTDYYSEFRLGRNIFTERSVHWHDLAGTVDGLGSTWLLDEPWWERLELTWTHLRLAAWHQGNFGLGPRIFAALSGGDDDYRELKESMTEERGYQALEDWREDGTYRARARRLQRNPGEYEETVASLRERQHNTQDLATFNLEALRRQQQMIADAGLKCVYVMPPMITPPVLVNTLDRDGHLPTFINLDTPARVPELYELRHRFDRGHLNRDGSELFSFMFADEVIAIMDAEREP